MTPVIRQRDRDPGVLAAAEAHGYDALQAAILSARLTDTDLSVVRPTVRDLDPPDTLPDIDVAADAIAEAITSGRPIAALTDYDCDGSSSAFVLMESLVEHFHVPTDQVTLFITHRMREGYGVSDRFVDRLLADCRPNTLLVTADQGTCDNARFERLRAERGCEVVVTDHHGVPDEGPPAAALACVNPVRKDSVFPDRCIAGCYVAWLTMCAVRQRLIKCGWLAPDAPSLACLLDVVCVGSVADLMSLRTSKNNRAVINYGLRLINGPNPRPVWAALRTLMKKEGDFTTKDLSHGAAPRFNAASRINDAMAVLRLLRTRDPVEAMQLVAELDADNQVRKSIQQQMSEVALEIGGLQAEAGRALINVHFPDGHAGVHGIVASRLVEAFGRPSCCLSPKPDVPGIVTGSLRGVAGVNIREALATVDARLPGCLKHWGGHAGAAGVALAEADIDRFHDALCDAVLEQADTTKLQPVLWVDGELGEAPSLATLERISALEPYGREFEAPVFVDRFTVTGTRVVGDGTHLKLELEDARGQRCGGIWFRAMAAGDVPPVGAGEAVRLVYSVALNCFRGKASVDLQVQAIAD